MKSRSVATTVAAAAILVLSSIDAGAQVKAGPEFKVNSFTTDYQTRPEAAVEPDGDFVVTWQSLYQDGSYYGVFGQRYSRDGSPRGGEFLVNTFTTGYQQRAKVAVNKAGKFVVVWESYYQNGYQSIFGQRYDANGRAAGRRVPGQ